MKNMLLIRIPVFSVLIIGDFLPRIGIYFGIDTLLIKKSSLFLGISILPVVIILVTFFNLSIDKKENKNA